MLKVYDDIIFSLQKSGGGSVYWAENISRNSDDSIHYAYDNAINNIFFEDLKLSKVNIESSKHLNIKRFIPPKYHIQNKYIFHSSYFRYSRDKSAVNITTVFDLTVEKFHKGFHALGHSLQLKLALKHSDAVICISNNTKKDLQEFYPEYKGPIRVTLLGYNKKCYYYNPNIEKTNTVIFVGARTDYKKFDFAVNVLSQIDNLFLLIVGGGELSLKEQNLLERNLNNRYKKIGFISNDELREIYNAALFLFYPSEYEGFGIPLLEAQACGCPVVCQYKSSIPEVVENSAVFVSSSNTQDAVLKIKDLINNKDYYENIQNIGIKNTERFSWDHCAAETLQFYQDIYNQVKK